MEAGNPIDVLFGGMEKLGPGSDDDTRHVLRMLPVQQFDVVVDAGCGSGRQTIVLAKELRTPIEAIDLHEPFLRDLTRRANESDVGDLIHVRCMDMKDIPSAFPYIHLLWSEGAAYNIGFSNALTIWAPTLRFDGFVVVSELSWLRDDVPAAISKFFATAYPAMKSAQENIATAAAAGYSVLQTYTLPREAWVDGYYDILEPRARGLLDHPDATVREWAVETLKEIEAFDHSDGSYGYVFYILQRR